MSLLGLEQERLQKRQPKGKMSTPSNQRRISRLLGPVLGAIFLFACGTDMDPDVAALVNGRPIMMAELISTEQTFVDGALSRRQEKRLRRQILDQLIEEKLLAQEAEKRGLRVSEAELKQQVDRIRADYPGQSFEEMLVREFVDYEVWQENLRENLLIRKVTDTIIKERLNIKPEKWAEYYKAHLSVAPTQGRAKIKHITLPNRTEAEQALKQIGQGLDFDDVARNLLGPEVSATAREPKWVYVHRLPERMAQVITNTEVNQVSDIVKSDYGYTIFLVMEVEAPHVPQPHKIIAEIRRSYMKRERTEAYAAWMAEFKAQSKIIINPVLLAELALNPDEIEKR